MTSLFNAFRVYPKDMCYIAWLRCIIQKTKFTPLVYGMTYKIKKCTIQYSFIDI